MPDGNLILNGGSGSGGGPINMDNPNDSLYTCRCIGTFRFWSVLSMFVEREQEEEHKGKEGRLRYSLFMCVTILPTLTLDNGHQCHLSNTLLLGAEHQYSALGSTRP